MKKIINILILVALIIIIVLQLKNNKTIVENRIYHYDKENPIIVQAQTVKPQKLDLDESFTGFFDAQKDARINADIQGKIIAYYVDAGSTVKKGQPLVRLDDELLKLQLATLDVKIEDLKKDVKRYTVLSEAEAIQKIKLEKTQTALEATLAQKNTVLEKIKKTTVTAPFDGVVTMKMSEEGSFAAPGVPLLMLTNISKLKFRVNVSETELSLFQPDATYKIIADAYPTEELKGTVTAIGQKGNMGNTFPVELELQNTKDHKIKAKMFGRVEVKSEEEKQGIIIPAGAIVGSDIHPKVYLIKDGKAHLTDVKIAERLKNKVVVMQGIKEGDVVVTSGFINLFDGANVALQES